MISFRGKTKHNKDLCIIRMCLNNCLCLVTLRIARRKVHFFFGLWIKSWIICGRAWCRQQSVLAWANKSNKFHWKLNDNDLPKAKNNSKPTEMVSMLSFDGLVYSNKVHYSLWQHHEIISFNSISFEVSIIVHILIYSNL